MRERALPALAVAITVGVLLTLGILYWAPGRSVADLTQQLRAHDPKLRERAAKALGARGPEAKEAVPDLVSALGDVSPDVCRAAEQALRKLGDEARPAVPELMKLFNPNADPAARELAVGLLGHFEAKETIPELRNLFLTEPRGRVDVHAFAALWQLDPDYAANVVRRVGPEEIEQNLKAALPVLANALREKSTPASQKLAAEVLAAMSEEARRTGPSLITDAVIPRLTFLWRHGKPEVRGAVAKALRRLDPVEADRIGIP